MLPHRYGNSHATWDHTVLPATRQRWHSRPYSSRSWYSIKRPRRDARLSWPSWHYLRRSMFHRRALPRSFSPSIQPCIQHDVLRGSSSRRSIYDSWYLSSRVPMSVKSAETRRVLVWRQHAAAWTRRSTASLWSVAAQSGTDRPLYICSNRPHRVRDR